MAEKKAPKRRARKKPAWGESVQSTEEQRDRREQILFETAGRLFNQYGFHGTSMSQLTEALGLTKGAIYYYVKDKSDLLYKLHLKSIEATAKSNARAIAEGGNGYERIRAIVRNYVSGVTKSHTETFILLEDGALKPEQAAEIVEKRKELEVFLRDQIQAGIDDGSIVPCDPRMVSFALVGAMAWVTKWYEPDGPMAPEDIAKSMSDMLSRMVSATPSASLKD
jgi:TetR/AcrR family transcriptional regulator